MPESSKPPAKPKIPGGGQRDDDKQQAETLREQAKTETEQRPYLDTEGGE